jgi:hypothetical protein
MRTALFWVITQRVVVIPYQRFGTTYRFYLQGSRIQTRAISMLSKRLDFMVCSWTLKYSLCNKNQAVWNFVRPTLEVKCRTVAIMIRVVLLFPCVCKPEGANTVRAPDDERCTARNMLSL